MSRWLFTVDERTRWSVDEAAITLDGAYVRPFEIAEMQLDELRVGEAKARAEPPSPAAYPPITPRIIAATANPR